MTSISKLLTTFQKLNAYSKQTNNEDFCFIQRFKTFGKFYLLTLNIKAFNNFPKVAEILIFFMQITYKKRKPLASPSMFMKKVN